MKRIYKDRANKKICGVCAGVAEYLDVDPTSFSCWASFLPIWSAPSSFPTRASSSDPSGLSF